MRNYRIVILGILMLLSGCTARDMIWGAFGGDYRAGEGIPPYDRRQQFDADLDGK